MTKRLMVGDVAVGGGAPVSIQSMCNTKTDDVRATVEQIHAPDARSSALPFRIRPRQRRWTGSRNRFLSP